MTGVNNSRRRLMEYGLAQVTLVGELLRDPEFFYTQYGTAMCRCTLLATRKVASPDAESKEVTTWFNCVTFGKAAEALNQAAKGARLFMQGDLNMRPYARQD